MTLVVVKMVTLNQCKVVRNKITVVAATLLITKKRSCRFIRKVERGSDIFRDSRSNLKV